MIADSIGVEYPKLVRTDLNEAQKRILAAELNIARRQMTDAQKVQLGRLIEPDIAAEGKRRSLSNLRQTPRGTNVPLGKTRDVVADKVALGTGRFYERGKAVLDQLAQEPDGEQLSGRTAH